MKIRIILFLFVTHVLTAQTIWEKRSNGLPDSLLYPQLSKLAVSDSNTAIFFCHPFSPSNSSKTYLTTNSGLNWHELQIPSEINTYCIVSGSLVDNQHIWFCTGDAAEFTAKIFMTSNGGASWIKQFEDQKVTTYFNYIEMFDTLNGIAMGDAPVNDENKLLPAAFLRTSDGGKNWVPMNTENFLGGRSGDVWRRVDFVDINNGYFVESDNVYQKLYRTNDGGKGWSLANLNYNATSIKFYSEDLGICLVTQPSGNSYSFRTFDGSDSWEIYRTPAPKRKGWGTDLEFLPGNPEKVWASLGQSLYFSNDTGRTWSENYLNIQTSFYDIEFADEKHGWLLCDAGVYYTSNANEYVTETKTKSKFIPTEITLKQNYPNPFNPSTTIEFQLPQKSFVSLKIYDIIGNEIQTLVNRDLSAGVHKINFNAWNLTSGIYLYQLITDRKTITRKMQVIK